MSLPSPRLHIMDDGDGLHDTYDEWLDDAESLERRLKREGFLVVRVTIDPSEFRQWCAQRFLPMNGKTRSRFASEFAFAKLRGESK